MLSLVAIEKGISLSPLATNTSQYLNTILFIEHAHAAIQMAQSQSNPKLPPQTILQELQTIPLRRLLFALFAREDDDRCAQSHRPSLSIELDELVRMVLEHVLQDDKV